MTYDRRDIDMAILLSGPRSNLVIPAMIEESLKQTEIFHYLLAGKLAEQLMGGAEFNLNSIMGIKEKLDKAIAQIKMEKL